MRRLAECQVNNDKDVPWADFTQTWPRSSIRSQQWLRAKWRRLKSSIKDCDCLSLKGLKVTPVNSPLYILTNVLIFQKFVTFCWRGVVVPKFEC